MIQHEGLRAADALRRFVADLPRGSRVLDVGSGEGRHAALMRSYGLRVTTLDIAGEPDVKGAYLGTVFDREEAWDGVWASHVLEHQTDPGAFLRKCGLELRPGGLLAVTVPPMKPELVGGHLSLWTEGLLCYHLVLAGFDLSAARVGVYGYNISVLARNKPCALPRDLAHDRGDLERLSAFFPLPVRQDVDGRFGNVRW